jgi:hypothetical protein
MIITGAIAWIHHRARPGIATADPTHPGTPKGPRRHQRADPKTLGCQRLPAPARRLAFLGRRHGGLTGAASGLAGSHRRVVVAVS